MNRRQALRLLGLGAIGFAGCSGDGTEPTPNSTTATQPPSVTTVPSSTESPATRTTATETDSPTTPDTETEAETLTNAYGACQSSASLPEEPIRPPDHTSTTGPCNVEPEEDTPTVCMSETLDTAQLLLDEPPGLHGDTRYVTRFRINGDPLPLWPTSGLESVECQDGILVANRNHPIADDPATLTLERLTEEPANEPEHLITEQLFFDARLRDMVILSRTHRVDRVRLHGQSTSFPANPDEPRHVRYDGETYRYNGELEQA